MTLDNSYDQDVPITDLERRFLLSIDDVLEQVNQEGSLDVAMDFIGNLRRNQQIQGLGLAKLLYGIWVQWDNLAVDGDFADYVTVETGLSKQTIDKYRAVWEYIFVADAVPDEIKKLLMVKPIGNLILLVGLAREGDVPLENWKAIVAAPDRQSVQSLVRAFRGQQTSSGTAITIMMERDGQLKAKRGDEAYKALGFLECRSKDDTVGAAVERIVRTAGIVER